MPGAHPTRRRTARVMLAALLALGLGASSGVAACSGKRQAAATKPVDVVLYVTAKGEVVAFETTYAPTGANVSLDPGSLAAVGRSPNRRRFYMRSGSMTPAPELYLHTGKTRFDVWRPVAR